MSDFKGTHVSSVMVGKAFLKEKGAREMERRKRKFLT